MKNLLKALIAVAVTLSGAAHAAELMVKDRWIREAPPTATALAGYMVIHNGGDSDRVLVAAESPLFGEVQLHRTVMEEGMAKMIHQPSITIPAGGSLTFEPNGYHLMLMKPKQPLKAGDEVEITLTFEDGTTLPLSYEVRSSGNGGMPKMDHSGHDMAH